MNTYRNGVNTMCDFDDYKPMYLKDLSKDEQNLIIKYRMGDEETRRRILEAVFRDEDEEKNDLQSNAKSK